ncbi:MAG: DUF433 domain-containing protein [Planctomycetaceae bacterium]
MTRRTLDEHIEITPGTVGGKPRIAGRRITVQDIVVLHEKLGRAVDEVASEFDLTLADVHAALAYYFDNREEIDQSIGRGEALVEQMRGAIPSKVARDANGGG